MELVGLLQYLSQTPGSALATCCGVLSGLIPFLRTNHERALQSRDQDDKQSSDLDDKQVKMLSLLKDQVLSLLKTIVLHVKQGKAVNGFVCESSSAAASKSKSGQSGAKLLDAKTIYAQALRILHGFNPENGVQSLLDQVVEVLHLLDCDGDI